MQAIMADNGHPNEGPCVVCGHVFDTHRDGCVFDVEPAVPREETPESTQVRRGLRETEEAMTGDILRDLWALEDRYRVMAIKWPAVSPASVEKDLRALIARYEQAPSAREEKG
jgi:hypothetical protein